MNSPIIQDLEDRIASELPAVDLEQRHRNMLDECYGEISIGYLTFSASRIVEEMDPIAFRCAVSDSTDSENVVEIRGDYYDADDAERVKQEMIDELTAEIDALASDVSVGAPDDERASDKLGDLKNDLSELEAHSF
jgi:hypothetical protein